VCGHLQATAGSGHAAGQVPVAVALWAYGDAGAWFLGSDPYDAALQKRLVRLETAGPILANMSSGIFFFTVRVKQQIANSEWYLRGR
jgi:hypothetical protein